MTKKDGEMTLFCITKLQGLRMDSGSIDKADTLAPQEFQSWLRPCDRATDKAAAFPQSQNYTFTP